MIQFSCWRWFFHCSVTHTRRVEQHRKSRGKVARLPAYPGRRCSVDHLEKLWTDHEGNGAELWSRRTGTKGYSGVRRDQSFSSTSRCCYWTDTWTRPRLETGTVCRWGRHTVHTLSAESGRNSVKKGKRSRSAVFPAGSYPRSKISRGKETAFYFLLAFYILKNSTTWSNKTTGQTILLV